MKVLEVRVEFYKKRDTYVGNEILQSTDFVNTSHSSQVLKLVDIIIITILKNQSTRRKPKPLYRGSILIIELFA